MDIERVTDEPAEDPTELPEARNPEDLTLDECIARVRRAPEGDGDVESLYRSGLEREAEGDLSGALAHFQEVAAEHPEASVVPLAWYGIGEIHLRRGGSDALSYFRSASRGAGAVRRIALYRLSQLDAGPDGLAHLMRLFEDIRRDPTGICAPQLGAVARARLVETYARVGRPETAHEFFHRAIAEPPGEWTETRKLLVDLAGQLVGLAKESDAIALLASVIGSDSTPELCAATEPVIASLAASGNAAVGTDFSDLQRLYRVRCPD